ncbi:M20/M25/M40 family metallo-hydrolase, partial [Desulfofundulus sp.]|uniref:M20/M25/M40 family metallo-hydrolase n=1 Tax=Desulfofundulus sp. TaxID=2282750 RepID=UPI003C77C1B9
MNLKSVYSYVDRNAGAFLDDLFSLLRQPSISTRDEGVKECAELLANLMRDVGIKTTVYPTQRHPVVYGEIGPAGAPTVLVYGHYDVQPPEPLELWHSDPFQPVIREGKIYARGSSDNKGQLFAHVKGVQAYLAVRGELPLRVKFIFEGEEEISSPSLEPFVEAHRDL